MLETQSIRTHGICFRSSRQVKSYSSRAGHIKLNIADKRNVGNNIYNSQQFNCLINEKYMI
jgi:hypothetical protein